MTRKRLLVGAAMVAALVAIDLQSTRAQTKPATRPVLTIHEIDQSFTELSLSAKKDYDHDLELLRQRRLQQLHDLQDHAMEKKDVDLVIQLNELIKDGGTSAPQSRGVPQSGLKPAPARGKQVGNSICWGADDFVVDVWQNGKLVDPKERKLEAESWGATSERLSLEIHEGDWLVFQVVNDQMRWNGVRLFAAAVLMDGKPVVVTQGGAPWYANDDPTNAKAFIASYDSGNERPAVITPKDEVWDGVARFQKAYPFIHAQSIWGGERVTWIKLRVKSSTVGSGEDHIQ